MKFDNILGDISMLFVLADGRLGHGRRNPCTGPHPGINLPSLPCARFLKQVSWFLCIGMWDRGACSRLGKLTGSKPDASKSRIFFCEARVECQSYSPVTCMLHTCVLKFKLSGVHVDFYSNYCFRISSSITAYCYGRVQLNQTISHLLFDRGRYKACTRHSGENHCCPCHWISLSCVMS